MHVHSTVLTRYLVESGFAVITEELFMLMSL